MSCCTLLRNYVCMWNVSGTTRDLKQRWWVADSNCRVGDFRLSIVVCFSAQRVFLSSFWIYIHMYNLSMRNPTFLIVALLVNMICWRFKVWIFPNMNIYMLYIAFHSLSGCWRRQRFDELEVEKFKVIQGLIFSRILFQIV